MADLLKRTNCVMGVFDDDHVFTEAIKSIRNKNYHVKDAFTPFPVHGLEKAMGLKSTRLGYVAFIGGLTGGTLGLLMMTYMMHIDWQLNIGGKPTLPIPSFIPITFELTVLLSALALITAYLIRNSMLPGFEPKIYHPRATQDRFVFLVESNGEEEELKDLLTKYGAEEVVEEEYLEQKSPIPLPIKMK